MAKSGIAEPDDQGESPLIEVTDARGAQRVGLIWMLGISTSSAAVILMGMWALNIHHMNSASQNGNPTSAASPNSTATSPPATN